MISVVISIAYFFQRFAPDYRTTTAHAILNDIIATSLVFTMLNLLKLDGFKTACILLSGLFFYDIWWVFGTRVVSRILLWVIPVGVWPTVTSFRCWKSLKGWMVLSSFFGPVRFSLTPILVSRCWGSVTLLFQVRWSIWFCYQSNLLTRALKYRLFCWLSSSLRPLSHFSFAEAFGFLFFR